jgi:small subunit ribosomal protein S16
MLSIRLSRVGRKNQPRYRVVVMPKTRDPWAKTTEVLGHYAPLKTPRELVLKTDRVKYWIEKGAEVSDTLWNLFVDEKIVTGKKRNVTTLSQERRAKLVKEDTENKAAAEKAKADKEAKAQAEAEAKIKAAEEAKAKAEAEKAAAEEAAKAAEAAKAVAEVQPAPAPETAPTPEAAPAPEQK